MGGGQTLLEKQFNCPSFNLSWTEMDAYKMFEMKDLKLRCIYRYSSSYWKVGETWGFNYTFYYIEATDKMYYQYSQNKIENVDGSAFESTDGATSEDRYQTRVEAIAFDTIQLVAEIKGERVQSNFESILDRVDSLSKPDDIDDATANKIETAASKVLTAITNVGIVISILIIAILGIKYMLGSLEEKAEFKNDMIPYLVGAALLFGITLFVKIFMQIGDSISNL